MPLLLYLYRCYSYIGKRDDLFSSSQTLSLYYPGCTYVGIAMHEAMHAMGFYHTMSRRDRDNFIEFNYANIQFGEIQLFCTQFTCFALDLNNLKKNSDISQPEKIVGSTESTYNFQNNSVYFLTIHVLLYSISFYHLYVLSYIIYNKYIYTYININIYIHIHKYIYTYT